MYLVKISLLLTLLLTSFQTIITAQDLTKVISCSAIGSSEKFTGESLLVSRLPVIPANYPEACQIEAKAKIKAWMDTDIKNLAKLSNRACASLSGWAEVEEGICDAGGPPPICPVTNHWVRDPLRAREQFESVKLEREMEMLSAGCACQKRELTSGNISIVPLNSRARPIGARWSDCSYGSCPENYKCNGKLCVPDSKIVSDAPVDKLLQDAKQGLLDIPLEKALERISAPIAKVFFNTFLGALFDSLTPTTPNLHKNIYRSNVKTYQLHQGELLVLYGKAIQMKQEFIKQQQSPNQGLLYDPQYSSSINSEIAAAKAKLKRDMERFNDHYKGAITEREFNPINGKYDCQSVFEYQHKVITETYEELMSLPNNIKDIPVPNKLN